MRFEIHHEALTKPRNIGEVLLVVVFLYFQQCFLSFLKFFSAGTSNTKVPVKIIVINKIWLDRSQVYQHIIKLLQNIETLSHALSSWNSISLRRRSSHHLEEVLCNSQMLLLPFLLSYHQMYDGFQNVFFRYNTLHIFD